MNEDKKTKIEDKADFVIECLKSTQELLHRKFSDLNPEKYSFSEFTEMIMQYLSMFFVENVILLVQIENVMRGKDKNSYSGLTDMLVKDHIVKILEYFPELTEEYTEEYKKAVKNKSFN